MELVCEIYSNKNVMSESFPPYMGGSWKYRIYSPQAAQLTLCTHSDMKIQSFGVLCIILLALFWIVSKFEACGLMLDTVHCVFVICVL